MRSSSGGSTTIVRVATPGNPPLPAPAALRPFPGTPAYSGEGSWQPAGRLVAGKPAVYETLLVPPGGTRRAGIAWMDTSLLSARLYSGSVSPGGGPYKYTAPVSPMAAASLVIYANGSITVGAWGSDVTMTPTVVAVRQNLYPLVVHGKPTARAFAHTWHVWGGTCPCGAGEHGTRYQWRSGVGVFDPAYARDFITMSARPAAGSR